MPEEDNGGNQRGDVGVEDCTEGFVVGGLQGCGQGFACSRFLAESFVNENVRVYGHAHGENDARDARQREHKMKHRHRAEEDDHVYQEAEEGHDSCKTVVDDDEAEDERETGQSSHDAAANGVRPERRRDAARFFDLHRDPQRIFQRAGKVSGFLVREAAGNHCAAAIDGLIDVGRALDLPIKHDGNLAAGRGQRLRQVAEDLCPFRIQRERNAVTLLVEVCVSALDVLTGEFGPPFDEELELHLLAFDPVLVGLDDIAGRHDLFAGFNARDTVRAAGYSSELELRHALQFALRGFDLLGVQPWNLHQDALAALGRDHRFAHAIGVHALSDHLDRLVEKVGRDRLISLRREFDEERCSALKIETQLDLFRRRKRSSRQKATSRTDKTKPSHRLRTGRSVAKYHPKRMRSRSPAKNVNAGDMGGKGDVQRSGSL